MTTDTTVMEYDENSTSFENKLREEYEEAVSNGFSGTYEEYIAIRDYT